MLIIKNKSKGITLIALIITIIVMLIIAGVAMSMLSGEQGSLFGKTKFATGKYNNSVLEEQKTMDNLMSILINATNADYAINPATPTNGNVTVTLGAPEEYIIEYKLDEEDWIEYSNEITMSQNGNIYTRLKDNNGRTGSTKTINIGNIDTIPPQEFELTASRTIDSLTISGSTTDTADAGSNVAGIRGYQFKIVDGLGNIIQDWTKETSKTSYTFNGATKGIDYVVSMRAVDNAGNKTPATNNETVLESFPKLLLGVAKVGDVIKYDVSSVNSSYNKDWIVLYNDGTNVSIVSEGIVQSYTFKTSTSVVSILNNLANGYKINEYSVDARGLGTDPNNKSSSYYQTDFNALKQVESLNIGANYALAANVSDSNMATYKTCIRYINASGTLTRTTRLNNNAGVANSTTASLGIRPVIILDSTLMAISGNGTAESPYEIRKASEVSE